MTVNIIKKEKEPVTLHDIYNTWFELKRKYNNAIVMIRSGDKYISFEGDANVITDVTEMETLPLWKEREWCILPHYQIDQFLTLVIKAGYEAAICEPLSFNPCP